MAKFNRKMTKRAALGEGVLEFLNSYPFEGNIRELENMIEQGVALADDRVVRLEDIVPADARSSPRQGRARTMQDVVDEAETHAIEAALREMGGSKERAAEMLGLSATTLWRKMKRLNIETH
jgi:two-component system response regulator HydG